MKRSILLITMALMACASAMAQEVSVRVGLNMTGVRFRVDGQEYTSMQNFVWPTGSRHLIFFPTTLDEFGEPSEFQYADNKIARYTFSGWRVTGQPAAGGTIVEIFAQQEITEVLGTVTKELNIHLNFFPELPDDAVADGCAEGPQSPPTDYTRVGVVMINEVCYDRTNHDIWITAGSQQLRAVAYLGWVFVGWYIDNQIPPDPYLTTVEINAPVALRPVFRRAKRVEFRTNPAGLKIVVDRSIISTPPPAPIRTFDEAFTDPGCEPDYARLPGNAPLGFLPLCVGDFDFIPGSQHRLAAPESQMDVSTGQYWVFDGFDNGLGQNDIYTAGTDVQNVDRVTANFVKGVFASVITNVSELRVFVDGRNNWPGPGQNFVWGVGQTHTVYAPDELRDSDGRVWRFSHWSDGGEQEHTVFAEPGAGDFAVTAYYEPLGLIKITSNPTGMVLDVNGNNCTTPCSFDGEPGATLSVTAPDQVSKNEASRYEFFAWAERDDNLTQTLTFDTEVQSLHAHYRGSYLLTAQADPSGATSFNYEPSSPDGFYFEGTPVTVTVDENEGFRFQAWGGDASGTSPSTTVTMLAPRNLVAYFEEVAVISEAGIRNAAGQTPDGTVAPGSLISIFGKKLTGETLVGPVNPLAQSIGDTYVTVDQTALLPLIAISPEQINAQLLSTIPEGTHVLTVHTHGQEDVSAEFTVSRNAPGVFFNVTETGMPLVAALHEDGTVVTEENPARRGEQISFYGTGLGPWDIPIFDGFILPPNEYRLVADPVAVIAGTPEGALSEGSPAPAIAVDPDYAGSADGMVGTAVLRMTVGEDLPSGIAEIYLDVNGHHSNRVQLPIE